MFAFDAESLAMVSTLAGIVTSISIFLWKKLLKPAIQLMDDHEEIKKSIDTIKNEVTPNGGGSMKDAVNCLKDTCQRIEITQKVLDQRSKAALKQIVLEESLGVTNLFVISPTTTTFLKGLTGSL